MNLCSPTLSQILFKKNCSGNKSKQTNKSKTKETYKTKQNVTIG